MLLDLKNEQGFINAFLEFDIVNDQGKWQNNGEYLHIRRIWLHPSVRGRAVIAQFIDMLEKDARTANVKYVYWLRNNVRLSRAFLRETCLRRVKK